MSAPTETWGDWYAILHFNWNSMEIGLPVEDLKLVLDGNGPYVDWTVYCDGYEYPIYAVPYVDDVSYAYMASMTPDMIEFLYGY